MAIGYSGARAQTMLLQVHSSIGGSTQNVYIHTLINEVKPMLKVPFILNMIKNTNSAGANDSFANTRYYYNVKKSAATLISDSENPLANDPRTLEAENIKLLVKQIAPVEYAKKLSGSLRDLELQGAENAAAVAIADFIEQRRLEKQINLWTSAVQGCANVQKNNTTSASKFKDGAHYVETTYTTSDQIYNDLVDAINSFQSFGLNNSKLEWNRNIPYVMGINRNDMIIIISPTAAGLLLRTPGLYASDSGNELFKKMNLKEFMGVPMMIDATLPAGTNFMIMTTGVYGAIAYEECGSFARKVVNGKEIPVIEGSATMLADPNWSGFYRIDISDIYKSDILFPELILVSSENVMPSRRSVKKDLKTGDLNNEQVNNRIRKIKEELRVLNDNLRHQEEKLKSEISKDEKETIKTNIDKINSEVEILEQEKKNLENSIK